MGRPGYEARNLYVPKCPLSRSPSHSQEQPPKPTAGDTSGTGSENEGGGDAGSAKKKKKKTKKKKGTSQPVVQEERRRNQPLMFEFSSMFDALTSPPQPQQVGCPDSIPTYTRQTSQFLSFRGRNPVRSSWQLAPFQLYPGLKRVRRCPALLIRYQLLLPYWSKRASW